jgi:hypothetical protein
MREQFARPEAPRREPLRYLFVVTYGRSGSTLLNGVLNSIPGYLIRGENRLVISELHQWHRAIDRQMASFGEKKRSGPRSSWYGLHSYPREIALDRMRALVLDTLLRPGPRARVVGFKEIRWPADDLDSLVEFITELFPDSKFLFNTRNAADVAKSEWWRDAPNALEIIAARENAWAAVQQSLGERAFAVCYDDYARDVDGLRPLFAWLDEDFDRERLSNVLATRHGQ